MTLLLSQITQQRFESKQFISGKREIEKRKRVENAKDYYISPKRSKKLKILQKLTCTLFVITRTDTKVDL